jgi:hypothetical protein
LEPGSQLARIALQAIKKAKADTTEEGIEEATLRALPQRQSG